MDILLLCPANLATGGTEGIHNLTHALNIVGGNATILYVGKNLSDPQPKEYAEYECDYITSYPRGFKGVVIFPEVWGNWVTYSEYADCIPCINWQGVDVYNWHTPNNQRGLFLKRKDTIHVANSEYAMDYLKRMGLYPQKISDLLNDAFYHLTDNQFDRKDTVLYNPTKVKMTHFQEMVMSRCVNELGIRFQSLEGYSRPELIDVMQHHKLYIDFGVFSGRERLPREAVMCGCCILTSNQGTAAYYQDNAIPSKYKVSDADDAVRKIAAIIKNYNQCKSDFIEYQQALRYDKNVYIDQVRALYEVFNYHSCS